jgi:hypothetical protein
MDVDLENEDWWDDMRRRIAAQAAAGNFDVEPTPSPEDDEERAKVRR